MCEETGKKMAPRGEGRRGKEGKREDWVTIAATRQSPNVLAAIAPTTGSTVEGTRAFA